jgi:pilus assembly protein CpaE
MLSVLLLGPEDSLVREWKEKLSALTGIYLRHHVIRYPSPAELLHLLEEYAPDAVVVNLVGYNRIVRTLGRLAMERPQLPVLALHTAYDERLLLELMQLGVRELWFPPLHPEQMQAAVDRLSQAKKAVKPGSQPLGALIAFLPARGGCGTTTVALHTAAALQKLPAPVLLADFDFHNSVIAFWLKLAPKHGFHEALERAHWLDATLWKSLVHPWGELGVLTSPQASAPLVFSSAETSAVLDFARQNYGYVLVDLPEAIYSSCWEVLDHARQILLVTTPEMSSLYLARRKVAQLVGHGIPRDNIRLVLNRCSHLDLHPSEVEKFLNIPLAAKFANHYRAVVKAFGDGCLIPEDSKLGQQFARFAASLAGAPAAEAAKAPPFAKLRQIFSPRPA